MNAVYIMTEFGRIIILIFWAFAVARFLIVSLIHELYVISLFVCDIGKSVKRSYDTMD